MATNFKIHREYCNYLKLYFLLQTGPKLYLGIYYVNTRTYTTTEDRNPANNRINRPLSTVITWPGYATTNVKTAYTDRYPVIAQNIQ